MRECNRIVPELPAPVAAADKPVSHSAQLELEIHANASSESMSVKGDASARGELMAAALATSWRQTPTAPQFSASDLAFVTPLLLESGGGALAWRRVRTSDLQVIPAAAELQQAYRLHAIQAARHEIDLKQVLELFRDANIEPLLVKGWAIARHYAEPGSRSYGDIDLCVRSEDYEKARGVLRAAGDRYPIDLHKGMGMLDDRSWDELFSRSELVPLDEAMVRVLAPEDHLRVLCFHLLRHGVERAAGLCDIAVALETRPRHFNWDVCLGKNQKHADWIICTLGLAQELLDAEVGETPFAVSKRQPAWLKPAVLRAWARPFSAHFTRRDPLGHYLQRPRGLMRALAGRWPTPIVGTVGTGGAFNNLPRFPYQLGYLLIRSGRFLKQLATSEPEESFFTLRNQ
jgi:putative nucleotidyltransferase-like protein